MPAFCSNVVLAVATYAKSEIIFGGRRLVFVTPPFQNKYRVMNSAYSDVSHSLQLPLVDSLHRLEFFGIEKRERDAIALRN